MSKPANDFSHVQTVGQLRAALAKLADDLPVILSKDAEGNGFSPLVVEELDVAWYEPECTWAGERYDETPTDPDDQAPEGAVRALFLWPVN